MASRRAAGVQSWEEQRGGLLTAPPPCIRFKALELTWATE